MKEFEKIVGYSSVKLELERICDLMRNPEKYNKLGVKTPKGVLIHGDPGIGKTLIANCFIEASKRNCYVCKKDEPDGDFVKKIKMLFEEAKSNAPSIIFLDDLDKFANEDGDHKNAEEFITVQTCIDDIKDKEVFILATANELHCLPNSLLRAGRFDKQIKMNIPTGKDSIEIIKYYLTKKNYVSDIDINEVARILSGRSCAELEVIINEAGLYAGFDNKEKIEMSDIIRAIMRMLFNAPESLDDKEHKVLQEIAYHEAGHAAISEILNPDSVNIASVCRYDGNAGGVVSCYESDEMYQSKELMEHKVLSLLGGKAAIEIVFGKVDVGAANDIGRAFKLVSKFVDDFCSFGFNKSEFCFNYSTALYDRKYNEIAVEMERYYNKAKQILAKNRVFLDRLANELMEKKILTSKDIKKINKSCNSCLLV